MRTLKKTLALVLVVAMVLSFGVIGASADFTDVKADNEYKEAIDVLSGIGVINGMTSTTFEPDGSLTRAQAAKIIAYMLLGPTNAELISTATKQTFTDVPTSHWAAGYIEYCANLGIINGVGDGKFDPEAKLTSAAFTKMLLVALGYNPTTEKLVGESWAINVATLAVGAGITDKGISVSASTVVNRGQAAQLAFKTLTANMVNYVGGSEITVGDTTIIQGATRTTIANMSSDYRGYATPSVINGAKQDNVMQFVESKFPTLKLNEEGTDAAGRPARVWKLGVTTIGTYAINDAAFTWTESHSAPNDNTVTNALRPYTIKVTDYQYRGGVATDPMTKNASEIDATVIKNMTGNGRTVEVYATGNVINKVVVTEPVLATVTGKSSTTVTLSANGAVATVTATNDLKDYYSELSSLSLKDKVMIAGVVGSGNKYTSLSYVADVSTVAGTYTASKNNTVTVGGTAYELNTKAGLVAMTLGKDYTLVLDAYGCIVAYEEGVTSSSSYAYVKDTTTEGSVMSGRSYYANLVFTDGRTEWVKLAAVGNSSTNEALDAFVKTPGKFVTYVEGSNGYTVNKADPSKVISDDNGFSFTKNNTALTDFTTGATTLTNSTVFLIYNSNSKTYATYTGITNVPSTIVASGTNAYALVGDKGVVRVLVIDGGANASSDALIVYGNYISAEYIGTNTVYTYNALLNGEMTTVMVKDSVNVTEGELYSSYVVDSNNVITSVDATAVTTLNPTGTDFGANKKLKITGDNDADIVSLTDGILSITDHDDSKTDSGLTIGSDFTFYVIDKSDDTCIPTSLGSTGMKFNGNNLYVFTNNNGFVTYIVMVQA